MSSVNQSGGRSSGKTIIAVVLGILALLLVIQGIMFFVEPAKSLMIGSITSPPARANAHRPLWGTGALVIAVICLVGAWFTMRGGKSSTGASPTEKAAAASK